MYRRMHRTGFLFGPAGNTDPRAAGWQLQGGAQSLRSGSKSRICQLKRYADSWRKKGERNSISHALGERFHIHLILEDDAVCAGFLVLVIRVCQWQCDVPGC